VHVVHIGRVPVDFQSTGPLEISAVRAENLISVGGWFLQSKVGIFMALQDLIYYYKHTKTENSQGGGYVHIVMLDLSVMT